MEKNSWKKGKSERCTIYSQQFYSYTIQLHKINESQSLKPLVFLRFAFIYFFNANWGEKFESSRFSMNLGVYGGCLVTYGGCLVTYDFL